MKLSKHFFQRRVQEGKVLAKSEKIEEMYSLPNRNTFRQCDKFYESFKQRKHDGKEISKWWNCRLSKLTISFVKIAAEIILPEYGRKNLRAG